MKKLLALFMLSVICFSGCLVDKSNTEIIQKERGRIVDVSDKIVDVKTDIMNVKTAIMNVKTDMNVKTGLRQ